MSLPDSQASQPLLSFYIMHATVLSIDIQTGFTTKYSQLPIQAAEARNQKRVPIRYGLSTKHSV